MACQRGLRACLRGLRASQRSLRAYQEARGDGQMDGQTDVQMDRRMYGWTDRWTEFLPILQDFVPCQGRCPKNQLPKGIMKSAVPLP